MKKITKYTFAILFAISFAVGCSSTPAKISQNPNDVDIAAALNTFEGVTSTCIVTEENDPNGSLNKDKSYVGAVYFRLSNVDDYLAKNDGFNNYSDDACVAGTAGGGQIEIYKNNEDAKLRDDTLASVDGTILKSYHELHDNFIIRLSNDLTASQQKEIALKIYELFESTDSTTK